MPIPPPLAGLKLPAIAAPMFLTSGPDLVAAACNAGVLGTFPALNQRSTQGLSDWLHQIEGRRTPGAAPFVSTSSQMTAAPALERISSGNFAIPWPFVR